MKAKLTNALVHFEGTKKHCGCYRFLYWPLYGFGNMSFWLFCDVIKYNLRFYPFVHCYMSTTWFIRPRLARQATCLQAWEGREISGSKKMLVFPLMVGYLLSPSEPSHECCATTCLVRFVDCLHVQINRAFWQICQYISKLQNIYKKCMYGEWLFSYL